MAPFGMETKGGEHCTCCPGPMEKSRIGSAYAMVSGTGRYDRKACHPFSEMASVLSMPEGSRTVRYDALSFFLSISTWSMLSAAAVVRNTTAFAANSSRETVCHSVFISSNRMET